VLQLGSGAGQQLASRVLIRLPHPHGPLERVLHVPHPLRYRGVGGPRQVTGKLGLPQLDAPHECVHARGDGLDPGKILACQALALSSREGEDSPQILVLGVEDTGQI